MISVEDARARILKTLTPTGPETIALANAHGRVLAAPLYARLTHPPANVSAMDGYALRAADAPAGAVLKIIGAAPAGHPYPGAVGPGETVRIFTGSVVPEGADTVLIQENAAASDGLLTVSEAPAPGRNMRPAGQDFCAGDLLIPAAKRLTARDTGLAAAANHPWLSVHQRPRIAILATGDEISLPGEAIASGGIINSNAHALAAFVTACGAEPFVLPIAKDSLAAIAAGADAARGMDLLLTTGGVSIGGHDLVQPGLAARGLEQNFWKIAMRPGKPLMSGQLGAMPVLGLPGNPVSAFVCALLFLRPAIERLSGQPGAAPATETARLTAPLKANDQREDYLRASLAAGPAGLLVTPFPVQDSGMLRTLAMADALIQRPPHDPACDAGATVSIIRLDSLSL